MKQKQNLMKPILMSAVLLAVILVMVFIYIKVKPEAKKGDKEITIQIVIPEEETKEFVISTNALYLRQALDEEELIEGSDSGFGFFMTSVNGRSADASKEEWWCISKDGVIASVGVSDIAITDGDKYEITLTAGY